MNPDLRAPALVLSGEHDITVSPAMAREFIDTLPDAHGVVISAAAQFPPVEQPAATAAAISRFLTERA